MATTTKPAASLPPLDSIGGSARDEVERGEDSHQPRHILASIVALVGLYCFSTAFFLAKRSMPHSSQCTESASGHLLKTALHLSDEEVEYLYNSGVLAKHRSGFSEGCWMKRHVDGMAIIVVDALRFDFARDHLPKSVESRLKDSHTSSSSQLFQFVADPPTVTMQRLKGLTTGGLPTFADISGSFGGANVDEDSWVQQLKDTSPNRRGYNSDGSEVSPRLAFVGDDTWVDLFPTQFDDSHPFPSFNTRDLDTVDDGCLLHLPRQLGSFRSIGNDKNSSGDFVELVVAHFLGVDHVGHTFGPHNQHMDEKLRQMDDMLAYVLDRVDSDKRSCRVALVFGDHGMTEDGNHGGGTTDETNAALFAHFSPGCGDMDASSDITGSELGSQAEESFRSINQIDLVPTISVLLGLPIPYANLGGLVPALIPPRAGEDKSSIAAMSATALALNAAQVWNYLTTYSTSANALPTQPMAHLHTILHEATSVYKEGLASSDALDYNKAVLLFKLFLSEATDLGKQVWTRFDTRGMIVGIAVLSLALLLAFPSWSWLFQHLQSPFLVANKRVAVGTSEILITLLLMVFHCAVSTFSNSYIINEQSVTMFMLTVICGTLSFRRVAGEIAVATNSHDSSKPVTGHIVQVALQKGSPPLLIAACSRMNMLFVTGHGLDPSIRLHAAHHPAFFIGSVSVLILVRIAMCFYHKNPGRAHEGSIGIVQGIWDTVALICLALSWWEKRSLDHGRNGYVSSRVALIISSTGTMVLMATRIAQRVLKGSSSSRDNKDSFLQTLGALFRCMVFTVAVTGPSSAASSVMFLVQVWALIEVTLVGNRWKVDATVSAALWRLVIRQAFFATGHACAFNRLQYSSAFVATDTFYFGFAGASLFSNTFGWDIIGTILLLTVVHRSHRWRVWRWFIFYQMLETASSCISVSIMRRHLMVWAIFAPRFVFAAIFLTLSLLCWYSEILL